MADPAATPNRRILLIDDNRAIHDDLRKILAPADTGEAALAAGEAALFGEAGVQPATPAVVFEIASAYQGLEGVAMAQAALAAGAPFALAFADIRMPPGIDGLETARRLWAADPALQIVICTAHSDHSWQELHETLPRHDQLVILKKPFDAAEALQLAHALTDKWNVERQVRELLASLSRQVDERTAALQAANATLEAEVEEHKRSVTALQNLMSDSARAYQELKREMEQRRGLEDRVREQASLLDLARDAIVVRGMDERVSYWNGGAERLYGYAAAEALGRTPAELVGGEALDRSAAVASVMETSEWSGRLRQHRRDGTPIVVECHATLLRDAAGAPRAVMSIATDITARLAIEEKLQQSQRLDALGQLTGGIAHDFNNLLTVILGNGEMLAEQLAGQPRLAPLAEMVRGAAQRGADLTHRLLAFARRQPLEPQPVDVPALIEGMADLLRRSLGEAVAVEFAVAPGTPALLADPSQLENALLNLCINARDAMPGGGRIVIAAHAATLDTAFVQSHPGAVAGDYVCLRLSDTGSGIAPENLARVFEPFFTTKARGKGTGLGLAMVYGFVKQSQGYVTIDSELGRGTTVALYLPQAAQAPAAAAAVAVAAVPHGGHERILLVEDEDLLRQSVALQLSEMGYRVTGAANAAEALAVLDRGEPIDLLFTDVVMPGGMNGAELARAARARQPGLKVLFASGYTDSVVLGEPGTKVHFLAKPYRRADLATKLRAALAAAP